MFNLRSAHDPSNGSRQSRKGQISGKASPLAFVQSHVWRVAGPVGMAAGVRAFTKLQGGRKRNGLSLCDASHSINLAGKGIIRMCLAISLGNFRLPILSELKGPSKGCIVLAFGGFRWRKTGFLSIEFFRWRSCVPAFPPRHRQSHRKFPESPLPSSVNVAERPFGPKVRQTSTSANA